MFETVRRRTKHAELTQTLRDLVTGLAPGERLPSQTELMRRYRVSDRTVLRSLDDLRREGWIVRQRGRGTFVADPKSRPAASPLSRPAADNRTVAALALTPSPSPFYQRCLELLAQIVEAQGWSLVCHHARHDGDGEDALPLEALQPRGFVAFNFALYRVARRLQGRGHRTVILGAPPADVFPDVPCVYGDHQRGGYLATRHLLDLGHRRLAYARLAVPSALPSLLRSYRWRGHERALAEARSRGEEAHCTLLDPETVASWRSDPSLAADYFARPDAPTGVLVWNDHEAGSFLTILHHAGLRIPSDVSLIGYDALPEGACLPPLTTVDQHLECQLQAVTDLISSQAPPLPTQSVVIVPDLVQRASCAPPRS